MTPAAPIAKPGIIFRFTAWLLRWIFQLLYHQFAFAYDLVASLVSLGQWRTWVRSVIPFLHNPLVLELGYGPGHLQVALSQQGICSIGIDLSKQMSRLAKRRLRQMQVQPGLIIAKSQKMPFASETIPLIVATFPSEYINNPQTLNEIRRVLIPGGSAVVLLSAWITGQKAVERLAAWLFRVTGESPIWDNSFLDPARSVGFIADSETIVLSRSKLLVLRFYKPI